MPNLIDRVSVRVKGRAGLSRADRPTAIGQKSDPILTANFMVRVANIGVDFNLPPNPEPDRIGFSKISGISSEIKTQEVVRGSNPIVIEVPQAIKYGTAIFERGITRAPTAFALMKWFNDVKAMVVGNYSDEVKKRATPGIFSDVPYFIKTRNITIETPIDHRAYSRSIVAQQRNRPVVGKTYKFRLTPRNTLAARGKDADIAAMTTTLVDAWPTKIEFDNLDANASQVWIFRMEMKYSGILIDVT